MSVLEKLSIRGVRSFGPSEDERVSFSTPVTLFLGQNGCGKTTIIEAIKFALTGELPSGTRNGSGFINDPKLSGKSSTKANVKLRFRDVKGNYITVARLMEVSTKSGGNLTYKNLNHTVRFEDPEREKKEDISGRCADIDAYCAQKLNVSKAILNNVIFCHQENSNWPLEEGKKLKEKFDEIFGATEYNKCVEKLRALMNTKKVRIKVLKAECDGKKEIKIIVDKQRDKLNAKKQQLQALCDKIDAKQVQMEPMKNRLNEIMELEQVLANLQAELRGKEVSLKGVNDQKSSLESKIGEMFVGTDQELEQKISSFEKDKENTEKMLLEIEKRKKAIDVKIVECNKELQKIQVTIGQHKEEEKQHRKRCEDQKDLIVKAKHKLNVMDMDDIDDSKQILLKLKSNLSVLEKAFEELSLEKEAAVKTLQKKIDKIRESVASTKQNITSKTEMQNALEKKKQELSLKLKQLDASDSQVKIIEDRLEKLQTNLKKRKEEFNEHLKMQEIDELQDGILRKEQKLEKIEREYRQLHQNYVVQLSIDRENTHIVEKQNEVSAIKDKNLQNFELIFGGSLPEGSIEKALRVIQKREEDKLKKMTTKHDSLQKEITTLEAIVTHANEKLDNYKEELMTCKSKVDSLCKGRPFTEVLKDCYNQKEKLQKDRGQYRSAKVMFEAFINEFSKEKPCCPVCETKFENKQRESAQIIEKLKNKIKELPSNLAKTEKELQQTEVLYNKLQQLKPINDTIISLSETKIPLTEGELDDNRTKLEDSSMALAALKSELEEPKHLVEVCREVVTDASLLDRHSQDIKKSEAKLNELQTQLVAVLSNRTLEEVESEIDTVKMEISSDRKLLDNKKKLLDQHRERVQNMTANIQNETQKKLDLHKLVQERPLIKKQIEEAVTQIKEIAKEKSALSTDLSDFENKLKQATHEKDNLEKNNRDLLQTERNKIQIIKRIIEDIERLQCSIDQYVRTEGEKKLSECLEQLQLTKSKMDDFESVKNDLLTNISELQQSIARQATNYRDLLDNKTLRELNKKISKLEQNISDLKTRIGDHNYKSVFAEKQKIQTKWDSQSREINVMLGEQKEIEKSINELETDLNKPENKNVEKDYLKKYYEFRTEEVSTEDLEIYTRALEMSILRFHKERMTHINKTIRELWRNIYKGNDIDYIEIQTEENIGGIGRKRSYNYKVVQVKKGVSLEMRGQCSAGQRVLACLVIRMALAETFSTSCGILALDEPTTNLDRTNIASLSDALSKIITERERQRNFQLLIITHDEEFLEALKRDQSVSHFWRVQRNADGFSVIKKELI